MSKRLFALAGAPLLFALPVFAQTNPTGTLSGKITDAQGLPVPGATVSAQSVVLQGVRTAVTSTNGDYIVPFLPPGDYSVGVELSGFAPVKHTARIAIGQTATVNATLSVSTVSETVEVSAETSRTSDRRRRSRRTSSRSWSRRCRSLAPSSPPRS